MATIPLTASASLSSLTRQEDVIVCGRHFKTEACPKCGQIYLIDLYQWKNRRGLNKKRRDKINAGDGKKVRFASSKYYCPAGHEWWYLESDEKKKTSGSAATPPRSTRLALRQVNKLKREKLQLQHRLEQLEAALQPVTVEQLPST